MANDLIARVILHKDGSVHIAFSSQQTIAATVGNFLLLLSDPYKFKEEQERDYKTTTTIVNPYFYNLDSIPGLTLLAIKRDRQIICEFSELFKYISKHINEPTKEINLFRDIVSMKACDEKSFILKFYLDVFREIHYDIEFFRRNTLSEETQSNTIREVFNSFFSICTTETEFLEVEVPDKENTAEKDNNIFAAPQEAVRELLTVREYATLHGYSKNTVTGWIAKNKFKTQQKLNGHWYIHINDTPGGDRRKGRKVRPKESGTKNVWIKSNSYVDVQEYIKNRKLVTDKIRPYIRTYEEIKHYEKNNYKEVLWDNKPALIIDIFPEYYCSRLAKTNRELIKEGQSPVVPNNEEFSFDIHHIGQKQDSPFAIIPHDIHTIKMYSVFHQDAIPNNELHSITFEMQKKAFWNKYLEMYDSYGGYMRIPYLNSKHKKDLR